MLVQLEVAARDVRAQGPTEENPYYAPDTMMPAADALRRAGVQFLRAVGDATPAYTGALVATTMGLDVPMRANAGGEGESASASAGVSSEELSALIERTRARVESAMGGQ